MSKQQKSWDEIYLEPFLTSTKLPNQNPNQQTLNYFANTRKDGCEAAAYDKPTSFRLANECETIQGFVIQVKSCAFGVGIQGAKPTS